MCIYIYIYREREREILMYTHGYVYIYIYIYIEREIPNIVIMCMVCNITYRGCYCLRMEWQHIILVVFLQVQFGGITCQTLLV